MSRLRIVLFVSALAMIALLLIGCGASSEEPTAAPAAAPTAAPEATATPEIARPKASSEVPRMSVDELKEHLDNGQEVVIVDTRGQASYDMAHIAGAIMMPSSSIDSPLDDLPLDHLIVLYCS